MNSNSNRIFRHYKGGFYRFIGEGLNSETQEREVVYQALYGDHKIWVRPAGMFYGMVQLEDGTVVPRFEEQGSGVKVSIKLLDPLAKVPVKAHDDDFGYDCYAVSCEEIHKGVFKYRLGFALQIADRHKPITLSRDFPIRCRSSIHKHGMVLSNGIATIDDPYTGELSVIFYHIIPDLEPYKVGEKVCQLYYEDTPNIDFNIVDELEATSRGDNGYGSTGK